MTKRQPQVGLNMFLHGEQVRRLERDGKTWFAVVDVVAVLTGTADAPTGAEAYWQDLKKREPHLAKMVHALPAHPAGDATSVTSDRVEVVDLAGLLRLV